jgi:uncharacterized protein with HEPN domain
VPLREWRLRIEDILAALEKIREYTARTSFEQFRSNSMAVEAVPPLVRELRGILERER